jgi:hypothetical protein
MASGGERGGQWHDDIPRKRGGFRRQEVACTMSESKVIANQKTIVQNQKTIIANQAALRANQTTIKKNQATILKNQSAILKNQGALQTIIENQKEILARLNK